MNNKLQSYLIFLLITGLLSFILFLPVNNKISLFDSGVYYDIASQYHQKYFVSSFEGASQSSAIGLVQKMSHFLYPVSVAMVKALTGVDFPGAGLLVLVLVQTLLACVIYISFYNKKHVKSPPLPILGAFISFSLLIVSHIPALYFYDKHIYFGYITPTVFHNATMATLKPFALMLFLVTLNTFEKPEKDKNIPVIFFACILLLLSTFSKPSFTVILLPAISILVFTSLLHKKPLNWSVLIFGIVIPAISILAFQYYLTYTGPKESGLEFRPFAVMLHHSGYLAFKFILSIAFPLSVFLLYNKDALHDTMLKLAWLIAIFGFVLTYFMAESGSRFAHGNFGWSGQIGVFILFYASVMFLIKSTAFDCFFNWRELLTNKKLVICLTVYLIHFFSGLIWWYSTASLCYKSISPQTIW